MEILKFEPIPELSPRLRQCLLFIVQYFRKFSKYPTQKEIARGLGLKNKTVTVSGYLEPLIKKGYLSRTFGKRNIRLTNLSDRLISEEDTKSVFK
jgi:Mn-dependent DtxR family transcriptional regulator